MKNRVLIVQNVKANHHHVSYIDGLARMLDRECFDPIVVLQAGADIANSYPPINYELHLLPGGTYSISGQAKFMAATMNLLNRLPDIDIIHCSNPFSSIIPALLDRKLKRAKYPVVYDSRGLWVEFGVHSGSFSPGLAKIIDRLDVFAMQNSEAVIAISPKLKDVLVDKGIAASKISIVPGGVDLAQFHNAEPFDYRSIGWHGKVYGYVSSISQLRNSQDVIAAFDIVQKSVSEPVYLAMVGPVYEPEFFADFVRQRALQDKVKFFGQTPHKQVPGYVAGFDYAISYFPREDHLFHQVSLPYKVIEYFAAGKPTILSRQVCHQNIAADGVDSLFVAPTILDLAAGMMQLLYDEPLAVKLSVGAQQAVRRFSFEAISDTVEAVYERVLRARGKYA
jgi:glycosyltransferase involved in cell wall biosynthesis